MLVVYYQLVISVVLLWPDIHFGSRVSSPVYISRLFSE